MLICVNGVFGGRMLDVAERCGAVVHKLERPWGTVFDPEDVIAEARKVRPVLTAIVHAETSTGAGQPLDRLGGALHEAGSLFVVDCVTSLAGMPVEIEGFHLQMLNAVGIPDGVNDAAVRGRLLKEFSIELGGGLGSFKGKAWRIGLMGHNARVEVVERFLGALKTALA